MEEAKQTGEENKTEENKTGQKGVPAQINALKIEMAERLIALGRYQRQFLEIQALINEQKEKINSLGEQIVRLEAERENAPAAAQ